MSNEIVKEQVCLKSQYTGAEIWINKEKLSEIIKAIEKGEKLIEVCGNYINPQNLEILTAEQMEEITRRKNGQWKCKKSVWHDKGQKCECWMKNRSLAELSQG